MTEMESEHPPMDSRIWLTLDAVLGGMLALLVAVLWIRYSERSADRLPAGMDLVVGALVGISLFAVALLLIWAVPAFR